MDGLRADSAAARTMAAALAMESFVLIDVGCGGGLDAGWSVFGDRLQGYGFDPSLSEIERLTEANTHPRIRYICGFVGAPADNAARQPSAGVPFAWRDPVARLAWYRSAAVTDAAARGEAPPPREASFEVPPVWSPGPPVSPPMSDTALPEGAGHAGEDERGLMSQNMWHRMALADRDRPIVLPEFLDAEGVGSVDFIKIDADSVDFEILTSLDQVLADKQVLAVVAEVNFIGGAAANQHTFHNTDRFMRAQGFDLAHLSVRRYASAALPFTYCAPHPHYSMAVGGRPYQGDALYVRDFGYPDTRRLAADYSDDKLIKLAALLALGGRVDQAAEVLIMFRERLGPRLDIDAVLDALTAELHELEGMPLNADAPASYAEHMARFEADDPKAYGADLARLAWPHQLVAASQAEIDQLKQALALVTGSLSWRVTAPLRALTRLLRR